MLDCLTIHQLLDYEPATGVFTWLPREEISHFIVGWNKKFAGKQAGRTKPNKNGYLELAFDGKFYYLHRLAWLYMTGEWPAENIDHKDTDKINNRWDNLRQATVSQNGFNRGPDRGNLSGYKGVCLFKQGNYRRYVANISAHGKHYNLGYFHSPEEAHEAYKAAAIKLHGEFGRAA